MTAPLEPRLRRDLAGALEQLLVGALRLAGVLGVVEVVAAVVVLVVVRLDAGGTPRTPAFGSDVSDRGRPPGSTAGGARPRTARGDPKPPRPWVPWP